MRTIGIVFFGLLFVSVALTSTGGPDLFGYRWIDSNELGGPRFEWIDISSVGSTGPSGDDSYMTVPLPMMFEYYGEYYNQITICTNGWCALGSWSTSSITTDTFPSTRIPQSAIGMLWCDLRTGSGRIIYGTHSDGRFVVTFDGIEEYAATGTIYRFQLVLDFDRRSLSLNYLDVDVMLSTTRKAFIGIENEDGTIGLCYGTHMRDTTVLHDSLSILFRSDMVVAPPYFNDCYTSSDFETDGSINDWELGRPLHVGPPTVHSFPYCWATKKDANYSTYSNSILYPPRMNISSASYPIFDWWQWFETDSGRDGGVVEISTDDGYSWNVVHPENGYPCPALGSGSALAGKPAFSGASGAWEYQSINLSPFVSSGEVWLRFYFAADGTHDAPGWYIDDIGLHEAFGVVKGRVNLDYRVNNSGARIEVPELGIYAYSDSVGNYLIDSVKAGTRTLSCTRDSFVTQTHGAFSIARSETIEVNFLMPPILMSTNFDTNSAGGVATPPDGWQWGRPDTLVSPPFSAFSDTLCWGTNLGGNYLNNADWKLDFVVFLSADNPHMQVYHWYKLAGEYGGSFWDGANVKIANYYDTVWTVVPAVLNGYDGLVAPHNTIMGGEPCFGGMGYGDAWHREIFDLSMHSMDTVIVRFHLGADGAGTARGWYIDDLIILDYETPGIGENKVIWKPDQISMNAYPNPFNAAVNIEFMLPTEGRTTLEVLDLTGKVVRRIADNEHLLGGVHSVRWDGTDYSGANAPTGIYFARITSGHITSSKTLLLVK